MFISANLIPVLIGMQDPTFVPKAWHGYLFVVAICVFCFLVNGFLAKHLPLLEGFVLCFTVLAFAAIIIVICECYHVQSSPSVRQADKMLVVLSPKQSGHEVFQTFAPNSELGYYGTLELVSAQVLIFYSFVASDSTAHMAEETRAAATVIPKAMVWSYAIIGLLDFVMLLVVCFTWVDPEAFANSATGYPFLEQFITATGSTQGAVTLAAIMVILIILSVTNFMASTSRQVFAL